MAERNIKAENVVTDIFIMIMCSVFLLAASDYRYIANCKYTMFLVICGGYCTVMTFTVFQRFIFREGNLENSAARKMFADAGNRFYFAAGAAAVVYLLFTLASAFLSEYFPETIIGLSRHDGALTAFIYILMFLFVSRYWSPRLRHLVVFGISVIIFDAVGLVQAMGCDPLGLYPDGLAWADRNVKYSGEFIATIGNSDLVSAFLCIAAPLFLCLAVFFFVFKNVKIYPNAAGESDCRGDSEKYKFSNFTGIICMAAGIMSAALLVVIKVSAGILACTLAACFAVPLIYSVCSVLKFGVGNIEIDMEAVRVNQSAECSSDNKDLSNFEVKKHKIKEDYVNQLRKNLKIYFCIILCAAVLFCAVIYADGSLRGTAGELHSAFHGNIEDSFGSGRVYIYKNIIENIPENLFFGTGPDTVSQLDIEPFRRFDAERGIMITARIDTAHNEPLNILVCQGIFALAAWAAIILCIFVGGLKNLINILKMLIDFSLSDSVDLNGNFVAEKYRAVGKAAADAALLTFLFVSFTAYMVQSMFSFSSCATAPYFWLLCAAIMWLCIDPASARIFPRRNN